MPEQTYKWLPRSDILDFEELSKLVDCFTEVGVDKVRITGGEPLLRHGLNKFIRMLAEKKAIRDLALTTNGVLLTEHAQPLADAGLHRLTVSLDTLRAARFTNLTRRDDLGKVIAGIHAADRAGFRPLKIDTVVMRGINDDEMIDLIDFARPLQAEIRFIEYMDVGGATRWSRDRVVSRQQILDYVESHCGPIEPRDSDPSAPADRFQLGDGTTIGIISSTTQPFCSACDRGRLTADGMWYLCLYAKAGKDLRSALRSGASDEELIAMIKGIWHQRSDRGAEERLAEHDRDALLSTDQLRRDPHLEMHTRGG